MTTQTIYIAEDGTRFLDKDICLEYEAERSKFPTEPGIRLYDKYGNEIDINHIDDMAYYIITNSVIAKALLNKIRMFRIKQHYPLFTKCGHYIVTINGYFRVDQDLFDETINKLKSNTIFVEDKVAYAVADTQKDIVNKPNINPPPIDNHDIIEGFIESLKPDQ